jgi:NAD(P)-dependent dehydrogenase (short-subunit alcohol dehydrogenase family)
MSKAERVAVVTGASQAIGAALVQAFRSRGYRVVANSRSIKAIADPDVVTVPGDIADPKTADLLFEVALKHFGHVDTLVNNAGIFIAKPFTAYTKDDYAIYMATNVTGFFHITQRAVEIMNKQGRGHVVTITTSLVDHADDQRAKCARISHQGSIERGNQVARDRVCKKRRARECCFCGNHQDSDASGRDSSSFGVLASDGSDGRNV